MKQYKDYIQWILDSGVQKGDRTGTGTLSAFGYQMRFNLAESFPLVTLKKTAISSIIHELVWFLKGSTNTKYLTDNNVHIWDEWAVTEQTIVEDWLKKSGNVMDSGVWKYMTALDRVVFAPMLKMKEGEWAPPEGWTRYRVSRNGAVVTEYRHPKYWSMVLDDLIRDGKLPASCRDEIGDLGPVYGAQWRNWQMVVEEEDISFEAKLKRVVEWNDRHKEITTWPAPANSEDMSTAYGLVHRKVYSSQYPYFFEPAGVTAQDKHVNTNKFHDELESVIRDGKCTPPMYQHAVKGFDQIDWLINRLKTNPDCRRLIVSAWNVADLPKMALAPCHALFQFWSAEMSMSDRIVWANDRQIDYTQLPNEIRADPMIPGATEEAERLLHERLDSLGVPRRKLCCMLNQRKHNCAFVA